MKNRIENLTFDNERALYNLKDTEVVNCNFAGVADGESVLKECRSIDVLKCKFSLRYPMWHANGFTLVGSSMDDKTRAPLWYSFNGNIENSNIDGVKCLRECKNINITNSKINSDEFGWKCSNLRISDSSINSVYCLFESKDVEINNINMSGKYSFQYMQNLHISNSDLDTKDAFWHSKNVVIENSVLRGEYLAWFAENITFINCRIIGTQPLCYCKNLKLINCTMEGADFAFEYSDVDADIRGNIISVKNPKSGKIVADSVDEIIMEDAIMPCNGKVILREEKISA